MVKPTKASFANAGDRIRALPEDRRASIEALADEMAAELHLSEIRKALSITQRTWRSEQAWLRARSSGSRMPN